ncbi:hypothetical protein [Streptomyces nanshensis]|uniref:PknH-like extracellular domain-containing protein n=1 Tax=Streptomyces nanshensis TaxID=518642 RepID=A0A1E7L407_9ACTN|nr:hypothetical protein [Streptomyces nanshensis]OEV10861.1 hypothetical protein AN218_15615 [Streptomyces nanshensis]
MPVCAVRSSALGSAAVLAALGLTLAAGGPGAAADAGKDARDARKDPGKNAPVPGFLAAADLPPHASSGWSAGKVTAGLPDPEPFCAEGALPADGSRYREFHTDLDTDATQVAVVSKNETAAARLAAALRASVAACAADWLRETPGGTASWEDYGGLAAGDGAHVYGVHVSIPESEPNVHLFGVGRDGRTVTLVRWGEMGDLGRAPVADFQRTTRTAVAKLN